MAAAAGGGFADTFGGMATGIAGQAIGSAINYGFGAMAASKAYDRSKNMITRGPTYQRIGLEAGGYNPILALTGGKMPSSSGVQQARTAPGQYQPNVGQARGLLQSQKLVADTQAALNATRANSLAGEVAKAKALEAWYQTDEGRSWLAQEVRHRATPQSAAGAVIKAGAAVAPKFIEAFGKTPPFNLFKSD